MIKICQCCGAILKHELGSCENCGAELAFNAPSSMPSLNEMKVPEKINAQNDPFLVEHVLVNRIFAQAENNSETPDVPANQKNDPSANKLKSKSGTVSISVNKPIQPPESEFLQQDKEENARDPNSFFDSMNSAIENVTPLAPLTKYPKEKNEYTFPFDQSDPEPVSKKPHVSEENKDVVRKEKTEVASKSRLPKGVPDQKRDNIVLEIPRKLIWIVSSILIIGAIAAVLSNQPQDIASKKQNVETNTESDLVENKKSVLGRRGQLLEKSKVNPGLLNGKNILNGDWEISYRSNDVIDTVTITQTGKTFSGHGKAFYADHTIHEFDVFDGVLSENGAIKFTKRFRSQARQNGAPVNPIMFEGLLKKSDNALEVSGKFKTAVTIGVFNNKKTAIAEGPFRANLIKAYTPNTETPVPWSINLDNINMQQKYFFIALGIVGFCVILVALSLKLFSPSGLLNRWEKEKYVPSQYKSQHKDKLRLFAKKMRAGSLPLGRRVEWHWYWPFTPKNLALPPEERNLNPNILILGSSKKGKTRLMASMVAQDIVSNDRAVMIIDPDGSLSDLTIHKLASSPNMKPHADRVIIMDPTEESEDIHSFNPLAFPDDGNLQSAANAIVHGFKAMYTEPPGVQSQWSEQTANILRNAALLLMLNGRTLIDLPNLLQDNDFRDLMLEKIEQNKDRRSEYIVISDTWQQYKKLARTEQWINWVEPILNRIGPTLGDGRVRRVIDKPVSSLNLKNLIEEKKILIVRVPKGELDKSGNLLGSLLVTGIQKAALSLYKKQPGNQNPVSIYLEELDSYIEKDTLEKISNQSQRYQIGCIGSLKTLQHLPEDFKSCLTVNMGLLVAFSLPQKDAEILGKQIFRVDGRKTKFKTFTNFINPINTSPQFELIMDEEKLNMDRLAGQSDRTYFCYRIGTEAGVFKLHAPDFEDVVPEKLNQELLGKMWSVQN